MALFRAPTDNNLQTTLASGIDNTVTSLTAGDDIEVKLNTPFVAVINRVNQDGDATPEDAEYIFVGAVSGTSWSSITRGKGGTTAKAHSSGSIIELIFDVEQWEELYDVFTQEHTDAGAHKPLTMDFAKTGWIDTEESWSFSSWDADTRIGVITVPSNATTKYSPGMRVRISQSTGGTKYAIPHKVEATALTCFFQSGATLENEDISSPHYSTQKAPFGFPMGEDTWSVSVTVTSTITRTSAGLGIFSPNLSLDVGIGLWEVSSRFSVFFSSGSTFADVDLQGAISSSPSSFSHEKLSFTVRSSRGGTSGATRMTWYIKIHETLSLTSQTTFQLIGTNTGSSNTIQVRGDIPDTHISFASAYL